MRILLTIIFLGLSVSAHAKLVCYDALTEELLPESYCVDQRSFQSAYRAAVYESLVSQQFAAEHTRASVARSAYLGLFNYLDDRVILHIEQLARIKKKPDLYLDVVEQWLVSLYQRETQLMPARVRKSVTDRGIQGIVSSLGDEYAHYPAFSMLQYEYESVQECDCVSSIRELSGNILYVKIAYYANITDKLVKKKLRPYFESSQPRPNGLIIDVRGNPGGLMHGGIWTASLFLSDVNVLTLSDTWGERPYKTKIDDITNGVDIALLADGESASATEAMMLALRENDRVIIYGDKSFGKARTQSRKYLPNGQKLVFTTGRYLSPNGLDIQDKGIEPDFTVRESEKGCTLPSGEYVDAVICTAYTHLSH